METFDSIKEKGLLIYRYIRGSHAYGLEKPDGTSDVDEGAIYIAPIEETLGMPSFQQAQVADERNDTVWYEIGKWFEMLLKSNPNVLETLFIDDKFVLYEHPIMTMIKKHRDEFVTQRCFNSFCSYAMEQIKKARGLNKKIVEQPIKEHLEPLDFCYTFYRQGSTKIKNWLEHRGLHQEYCGLVNIPNMHDVYGVFYDFGMHAKNNPKWDEDMAFVEYMFELFYEWGWTDEGGGVSFESIKHWLSNQKPIGYRGMVGKEDNINIENIVGAPKIFDLRLSSIDDKDDRPICHVAYNSSGYTDHCRKYKDWKDWEKNRNPERFKENQDKEFDRKNIAHCIRLLHMGIEIARDGKVNVNRTNIDRDFILNVRLGNTQYDEIIKYITYKESEMKEAMSKSTLPKDIDVKLLNTLLVEARKEFYKSQQK